MKGKRLYISLAVIVIIALAGYVLTSGGEEVRIVKAEMGTISRLVEDTAIVQPVNDEKIYASQNARVTVVPVEIGQVVSQGQVLMTLENTDLQIQLTATSSRLTQVNSSIASAQVKVAQLTNELKTARTDFQRTESLYKAAAVSQEEYEKAKLNLDGAQAALKQQKALAESLKAESKGLASQVQQLETKSGELQVVSPVAGTILDLPVKNAQPVSAGSLLAAIGSSDQLELKADILSDDLAAIKIGQEVMVSGPVLGEKHIKGQVIKIYPRAQEQISALGVIQRRVPVIIALSDKANLQPGYEVRVAIETSRLENVLVLPIESVRSLPEQKKQVMLIKDNRVIIQNVKTGLNDQNYVQITSGLKADDTIVRDANLELKANARIKPLAD